MRKAARAIIIEDGKLLVMHRNKEGSQYFTLVGGGVKDNETLEQALVREVKEETGMDVIGAKLVFIEEHPAPYNEQYIFLCKVAPHEPIALQINSEESYMNRFEMNIHTPAWCQISGFTNIPFRTPQLQEAIVKATKHGFPDQPIKL